MNLRAILLRSPVDSAAARVTSQRFVSSTEEPLTREELRAILTRLIRKHRLLKHVLGIRTRSQQNNLMHKVNKRLPQFRQQKEPRAFAEYVLVGQQIQSIGAELSAMRKARRFVAELQQESREAA